MITGELRSQIDKVWDTFWSGGLANPLLVMEQITYLLFIKRLDEIQTLKEKKANDLGKPIEDPIFTKKQYELRWSKFKDKDAEIMYQLFTKDEGVFAFIRSLGNSQKSTFSRYMKGATFMIPTPRLLSLVVDLLNKIDMSNRDTKGDVYEYLLSKIASAGQNGQFRTPRHIIKLMVAMMEPTLDDVVCDPSAGSCGFLVTTSEYIREKYPKDLLKTANKKHFENKMFMGMEFDPTMLRIGAMNMMLHGIEGVQLKDVDALSQANAGFFEACTLVLANPPFKGSLDEDVIYNELTKTVKTKKTELLFLALMLRGLKPGGRAAVIVPDGVLFGSNKAHVDIRKELIERHHLQAVISMPSGVFKPYAGVSTAILIFQKSGKGGTKDVWFCEMTADGYSLDDKRTPQAPQFETFKQLEASAEVKGTDLPHILHTWRNLKSHHKELYKLPEKGRNTKSFFVTKEELAQNNYDLSMNRYRIIDHVEVKYEKPKEIIKAIRKLDEERSKVLVELEKLLK